MSVAAITLSLCKSQLHIRSLLGLHRHLVNHLADAANLIYRPHNGTALDFVLKCAGERQASTSDGGRDFRLRSCTHQFLFYIPK